MICDMSVDEALSATLGCGVGCFTIFVFETTIAQAIVFVGSSHLSGDWRVQMRGGEGRLGEVTPPVWSSTRSR